jgi:hypothetical protein
MLDHFVIASLPHAMTCITVSKSEHVDVGSLRHEPDRWWRSRISFEESGPRALRSMVPRALRGTLRGGIPAELARDLKLARGGRFEHLDPIWVDTPRASVDRRLLDHLTALVNSAIKQRCRLPGARKSKFQGTAPVTQARTPGTSFDLVASGRLRSTTGSRRPRSIAPRAGSGSAARYSDP